MEMFIETINTDPDKLPFDYHKVIDDFFEPFYRTKKFWVTFHGEVKKHSRSKAIEFAELNLLGEYLREAVSPSQETFKVFLSQYITVAESKDYKTPKIPEYNFHNRFEQSSFERTLIQ